MILLMAHPQQVRIQSNRDPVPASEVLMAWAVVAEGGKLRSWRMAASGGDADVCDFHVQAYHHVQTFFRFTGCGRFRALAKRLALEGREPSMRELPDAMQFATRFRRWYRKHPITMARRLEEA